MPWHLGKSDKCPASKPHAVIKDADGSVAGCHVTEADAKKQLAALYASEPKSQGGQMQHKVIKAATTATDQGQFTAIAAAYSVDRGNEQIERGAFEKTIARWQGSGKKIPLHWDHSANPEDIIGAADPAEMRESEEGLYVKGQLDLENKVAREAWRLMKANVIGLSFGYLVNEDEEIDGVKHLKAIDLFELTITPAPMNPDTRVLDMKSHETRTELDEQAEESPGEEAIEEAAAEEPAERLVKAAAQDPLRKAYEKLALELTTRGIDLAEPPKVEEKPVEPPSMAELRRQHYDLMLNILTEGKQ